MARDVADRPRGVRRGAEVHVDDLHAAAAAGRLVEHRQVGVVALGGDVGDAPVAAELAAEVEAADQLEPCSTAGTDWRPASLPAAPCEFQCTPQAGVDPAVRRERRRVRAGAAGPYEESAPAATATQAAKRLFTYLPSEDAAPLAPKMTQSRVTSDQPGVGRSRKPLAGLVHPSRRAGSAKLKAGNKPPGAASGDRPESGAIGGTRLARHHTRCDARRKSSYRRPAVLPERSGRPPGRMSDCGHPPAPIPSGSSRLIERNLRRGVAAPRRREGARNMGWHR